MFEEKHEKLIRELRMNNELLIVEGKNDKKALITTGLANIIDISGKRLEDVVGTIKNSKETAVTILTDFDREGVRIYRRLKRLLSSDGISSNDMTRSRFRKTFLVSEIEELASHFK